MRHPLAAGFQLKVNFGNGFFILKVVSSPVYNMGPIGPVVPTALHCLAALSLGASSLQLSYKSDHLMYAK